MNNYIGCKIIKAEKMTYGEYKLDKYGKTEFKSNLPDNTPGYKVVYPGVAGSKEHISWSPKAVFELAYRPITDEELKLLND